MRGGEEADFAREVAGALVLGEDGGDEGAYAAFAFGAGYVDYIEGIEVVGLIENVSRLHEV